MILYSMYCTIISQITEGINEILILNTKMKMKISTR